MQRMQAEEAWQRGDVATEQEQEQAQDSCCVSIAAPMEKHAMQTDMGVVEVAADAEVATAQYLNHEWPGSLLGPLCSPPLMMHHGEPMPDLSNFAVHQDAFGAILGPEPKLELLLEHQPYPFAHEAGVFIPSTSELFITSNRFYDGSGPRIQISKISVKDHPAKPEWEEIHDGKIVMANGGVNYKDGILFCSQGSLDQPAALYHMSASAPYTSTLILDNFHGRHFNSVNDVVVHSDGSIWFTDPIYGFEQGYRSPPQLPNQVYRYDPHTKNIRAVADGFGRPNGICFSPDEKIVYITDTDWIHGDGTTDNTRPSSIYAFDVAYYSGQPFLINRRLFAFADSGIPDGIKVDLDGNVYSGCGDGLNVWSPGGVLLGRVLVEGGVANFCFGRRGEVFLLNEHKLWRAQLANSVRGALLRL